MGWPVCGVSGVPAGVPWRRRRGQSVGGRSKGEARSGGWEARESIQRKAVKERVSEGGPRSFQSQELYTVRGFERVIMLRLRMENIRIMSLLLSMME